MQEETSSKNDNPVKGEGEKDKETTQQSSGNDKSTIYNKCCKYGGLLILILLFLILCFLFALNCIWGLNCNLVWPIIAVVILFAMYWLFKEICKEIDESQDMWQKFKYRDENDAGKSSYNLLLFELKTSSKKHRRTGVWLTICLVLAIVGITYAVNFVFIPNQARIINYQILLNNNPSYLVVYYLGRAIIFGSFFSGSMFFLYRLAKSSFDQSVRYRRRLNSILYKNYLFDSNIISKEAIKIEKIDDFVKLSEIFIKSESTAFSDKTNNESVKSVEGSKDSFKFSSNDKNNEG